MIKATLSLASTLLLFGIVAACNDAPDLPEGFAELPVPPQFETFPVVPPDPYEFGDERLEVGIFYGGDASEVIGLNGGSREYFIFQVQTAQGAANSFEQTQVEDRLEGRRSDALTLSGTPFWGGGIIWLVPIDISKWTTLNVAFKSSDPSFETFDLTLQSGPAGEDATGFGVDVRDYGFVNDGQWQFLQIPLQDFVDMGWDPENTRSPFIVGAGGGNEGDVLLIDNLYFTRELEDLVLGAGGTGGTGG